MNKSARKAKITELIGAMHLLADGRIEVITPPNGKKFTKDEILVLLGCQAIELVRLFDTGLVFVVDAEGELMERARNEVATKLWRDLVPGLHKDYYIAGPCVVCAAPSG